MKTDLDRIGVPVIKELPVGKIMYDHVTHIGVVFLANTTGESLNTDRAIQPSNVIKYLHGQGILTIPGGTIEYFSQKAMPIFVYILLFIFLV